MWHQSSRLFVLATCFFVVVLMRVYAVSPGKYHTPPPPKTAKPPPSIPTPQTHLIQPDHLHVLAQRPPPAHPKQVLVHAQRRGPEELVVVLRVAQNVLDAADHERVEAVVEPRAVEGPPHRLPELGLVPTDVDVREHVDGRGEDVVAVGEGAVGWFGVGVGVLEEGKGGVWVGRWVETRTPGPNPMQPTPRCNPKYNTQHGKTCCIYTHISIYIIHIYTGALTAPRA